MTRAATLLHVSQSVLSTQIKRLEEQLGHALFNRVGRTLQLTEAGRMTLTYAESIFTSGTNAGKLRDGGANTTGLRIGSGPRCHALQENFVALVGRSDVELGAIRRRNCCSASAASAANRRVHADANHPWRCRSIARQPVSLVGRPRPKRRAFRFPQDLAGLPLLLPSRDSDIRAGFDLLCEQHGLHCRAGRSRRSGLVAPARARLARLPCCRQWWCVTSWPAVSSSNTASCRT